MPELPEVETTRRGLEPHAVGRRIQTLLVHDPRLRWPVAADLAEHVRGRRIDSIDRRAKYLLFALDSGDRLMLHLGMSGSVRVVPATTPRRSHDHVELQLDSGRSVRFNDPRRFGSLHRLAAGTSGHPLLDHLGPEPLSSAFTGGYLHRLSRGRRAPVKAFLMDSRIVVGVGNIYANEALHHAAIHPARAAGRVSLARYNALADAVRAVLTAAIGAGGTTLRDFASTEGTPGYFQQRLDVYARGGLPCRRCGTTLRERRLGQRSTVYCQRCQR
jgi:formamidopyrimidine-DNA glycosylase